MQGMMFFTSISLRFHDLGDRSGRAIGFPIFPTDSYPPTHAFTNYLRAGMRLGLGVQ